LLSKLIDICLMTVKWPLAFSSIIILPFAVMEFFGSDVIGMLISAEFTILIGFSGYVLLWLMIFKRRFAGSLFSTFEHELTHALFAWLTFKRVVGLRATWNSGGVCEIEGENWLIYIAPYFFPTLLIAPILVSGLSGYGLDWFIDIAFGSIMAYHMTSTYIETHRDQTDLKETSFLFAFLFLPAANVMIYSCALIYYLQGFDQMTNYISNCWSPIFTLIDSLLA